MPEPTAKQAANGPELKTHQAAFTFKAFGFGLLALLFIIVFDNYNEFYLNQQSLNSGFLPPGPLFFILGVSLLWNPIWHDKKIFLISLPILILLGVCVHCFGFGHSVLSAPHWLLFIPYAALCFKPVWSLIAPRLILNSRELIVALSIVFVACWTAGAGLAQFHAYTHIVPWTIYETKAQQQRYQTLEYVPEHLWPAAGLAQLKAEKNTDERNRVYDAFLVGHEKQGTAGTPWDAWSSNLIHWIPMLVCLSACFIALSLIVHQQWAKHEQLSYPLANIATSIFDKKPERMFPNMFYLRSFWVAFIFVACFHGIRMLHAWWPNNFPTLSTRSGFGFLMSIFPTLAKSGSHQITDFSFLFSAVGICYFLSREIGLTLGVSKFLLAILGAQVYLSTGTALGDSDISNSSAGAYIAYAAVILYTGRNYYRNIIIKAVTFGATLETEKNGVFGARLLILGFLGLVIALNTSFQIDLFLAFIFALLILLMFLVFTRIICETGIPYLQVNWQPSVLIAKVLGISAVGAAPLVIMQYITTAAFMDAKNTMMPFVSNSLKMADNYQIKLRRMCIAMLIIVAAAIVLSLGTRLHQHYSDGANKLNDSYGKYWVQNNFLNVSTDYLIALDDIGQRPKPGAASELGMFDRLLLIKPDTQTLSFMALGAAAVFFFFFLRFRYSGFALHPVMFLIWGTYPLGTTFYSFLIGWVIRELIIRFGGDKVYQQGKPFFIGLIVGELFIIMLSSLCGFTYNALTNEMPPKV